MVEQVSDSSDRVLSSSASSVNMDVEEAAMSNSGLSTHHKHETKTPNYTKKKTQYKETRHFANIFRCDLDHNSKVTKGNCSTGNDHAWNESLNECKFESKSKRHNTSQTWNTHVWQQSQWSLTETKRSQFSTFHEFNKCSLLFLSTLQVQQHLGENTEDRIIISTHRDWRPWQAAYRTDPQWKTRHQT